MSVSSLLDQFPLLATAPDGVKHLRELILELAVRGKLVPQDPTDEPARELLKRIQTERAKLIADGKIKKDKPLPEIGEEEKPFDLPNGWEWVRLGAVTTFGHTDKSGEIVDSTWVLDLEDIEKDTSVLLQKVRFVDRPAKSDKNRFQAGDVLYGKLRPYLNKVIVADEAGVCTTEILPVRGLGGLIFPRYLMHALKRPGFLAYVNAKSYGMKMPRLGTDDGRKALLPLPPLAEQHRIVAKVDELMALCDRLEAQQADAASAHASLVKTLLDTLTQSQSAADFAASWQRIAQHFDTLFTTEASIDALKQTLLQLAVMGKLVPRDPNDEPASGLFKRIQAEKAKLIAEGKIKKDKPLPKISEDDKPFELPGGWEWVRLIRIVTLLGDGLHGTPEYSMGTPYYFINGNNLINGEIVIKPNTKTVSFEQLQKHKKPLGNTTVLVSINGSLGSAAFYDGQQVILGKSACFFNLVPPIDKRYIRLLIESPYFQQYAAENATGTTIRNLSLRAMNEFPVPLPALAEQHRIVAKVDELMALCDQLAAHLKAARELAAHYATAATEAALEAA